MTPSQRKAYLAGVESGRFNSIKARILTIITGNKCATLAALCRKLKLPINTISGRVSELLDDGILIEFTYKEETYFGRALDSKEANKSANHRAKQRYDRWLKLGQKNGWIE